MIEFDNVRCQLGDQAFLFSLHIESNTLTMVAGVSGSGKTTFLNLLAGFEIPESGSIFIDQVEMKTLQPAERPVSLVFQDNNLFAHLSVESNVGLGLRPSLFLNSVERQEITSALENVGLAGFEKRMPQTLSGGERQRVAFARALVRKKKILALDEPFAALDPAMRREMGQLLLQLQKRESNTVVMVTHNPDDVLSLATHVVFLDKGQVVFSGTVEKFAKKQDNAQIVRFLEGETLP